MRTWLAATALCHLACLDAPGPPLDAPDAAAPSASADQPDGSAAGGRGLSCDEEFGGAPGYLLCSETEDTCTFFSETASDEKFDCDERCGEFGAACLRGFDSNSSTCVPQTEDGCAMPHETQICVCRRT
jgi:hypothetical protein